jgi:hypothetical protein
MRDYGLHFMPEDYLEVHHRDGNHNDNPPAMTVKSIGQSAHDKSLFYRRALPRVKGNFHVWFGSGGGVGNRPADHN